MADALIVRDTAGVGRRGHDDRYLTGGLVAGEALDAVAPCFVHSDGLVYMSKRDTHLETDSGAALYVGFTDKAVAINQPVTLWISGTEFHYAAATMTVGGLIYVADTNGRITQTEQTVDVVTASGTPDTKIKIRVSQPIAYAKTASEIVLL